jgi:hypothetical protein
VKRFGVWAIYIVGALSIGYLALFAYAMWRQIRRAEGANLEAGM